MLISRGSFRAGRRAHQFFWVFLYKGQQNFFPARATRGLKEPLLISNQSIPTTKRLISEQVFHPLINRKFIGLEWYCLAERQQNLWILQFYLFLLSPSRFISFNLLIISFSWKRFLEHLMQFLRFYNFLSARRILFSTFKVHRLKA